MTHCWWLLMDNLWLWMRPGIVVAKLSMGWLKGKSSPETIDFPMKIMGLSDFPSNWLEDLEGEQKRGELCNWDGEQLDERMVLWNSFYSIFFPYGCVSKPIIINVSGVNIHLPSILMFTGVPRFWPMAICWKESYQLTHIFRGGETTNQWII